MNRHPFTHGERQEEEVLRINYIIIIIVIKPNETHCFKPLSPTTPTPLLHVMYLLIKR